MKSADSKEENQGVAAKNDQNEIEFSQIITEGITQNENGYQASDQDAVQTADGISKKARNQG